MNTSPELYISALHVPADSAFAALAASDHYKIHQLISKAFSDLPTFRRARILFRFDLHGNTASLFIQSRLTPDWSWLDPELRSSLIGPVPLALPPLSSGAGLRFRLLARPSKRVADKNDPRRGRRISLGGEHEEEDQRLWLARKGELHGFRIEHCTVSKRTWYDSRHPETLPNGQPKPISAAQFDGTLTVTDPSQLTQAIALGIGTQKAFGFGLLSVAPL